MKRSGGRPDVPVVSSADLSELVGSDAGHGLVVGGLVILDGNLRSHSPHGVDASPVACLDKQLDLLRGKQELARCPE